MNAERITSESRFEAFYALHCAEISGYVRRRVSAWEAGDVIAEVFAVAWRRFEQIPAPPQARLWMFGVARRAVADHRRSGLRQRRLHDRLAGATQPQVQEMEIDPASDLVREAMARLRPKDREVLRLVLWEELSHSEAAVVLGCSPNTLGLRFRRAQGRIGAALAAIDEEGEPTADALSPVQGWKD